MSCRNLQNEGARKGRAKGILRSGKRRRGVEDETALFAEERWSQSKKETERKVKYTQIKTSKKQ